MDQLLIALAGVTLTLRAAARIPSAQAAALRACVPVIEAARDLRAAFHGRRSALSAEGQGEREP